MGFPVSEAYILPMNAKSLVGSVMANLFGSHYPLHMSLVDTFSQMVMIDKVFSVPKCVQWQECQITHISGFGRCWEQCEDQGWKT